MCAIYISKYCYYKFRTISMFILEQSDMAMEGKFAFIKDSSFLKLVCTSCTMNPSAGCSEVNSTIPH